MKKIIKHGRPKKTIRRFACTSCACIFEADQDEYEAMFDRNEEYYHSSCPECGKTAYSINPN